MTRLLPGVAVALALSAASVEVHAQDGLGALRAKAQAGDAQAESQLGLTYLAGAGVASNRAIAFCWLHRAAEHGYPAAWLHMGLMYSTGEGVAQDDVEALKWFTLVQRRMPRDWSGEYRDWARKDAAAITRRMSRSQVAEGRRRASDWWKRAAARGRRAPGQAYVAIAGDWPSCGDD